ncbi:MAG: hypothetical protein ACYC27_07405 [Armatimonadota bacterium]
MFISTTRLLSFAIIFTMFGVCIQTLDAAQAPRAAVIEDAGNSGLPNALKSTLNAAGYDVSVLAPERITGKDSLNADEYDLLVLPDSAKLPIDTLLTITAYMKQGGNIIALNAPIWGDSIISSAGRQISIDEYSRTSAGTSSGHTVVDFTSESIKDWGRGTNKPEHETIIETTADGPAPGTRAIHAKISNLEGWETFGSQDIENLFPDGNTLTVFAAKGGPDTTQAYIEWVEKDGSRWVAVFSLTQDWKLHVLSPEDFRFWQSNPDRGFKGDMFNPANAQRVSIGLSFSFTGWSPGRHEYWMGPISTASIKDEYRQIIASRSLPVADTLSPGYKFFNVTNVSEIVPRADQVIISSGDIPMPARIKSSHPRPSGTGFDKGRAWRWIPLIEAQTKDGKWCGNPATLIVNVDNSYKGAAWASFGIDDPKWYQTPEALSMVREIAERMKNPVYLLDGGTNYFTYFKDQDITLGARVANQGDSASDVMVRATLTDAKTGKQTVSKEWQLNMAPGETQKVSHTWKPDYTPANGFIVKTELLSGGKVIDTLSHETAVYQPKKKNEFVKINDGEFTLNGKIWRPNGVNYIPTYGMAMEEGEIFGTWLSAKGYDPEVIERDIRNMKSMGMNAVSIFLLHQDLKAQNLPDLLRRLDNHGMKANLSLRPGTPMDFPWGITKEMIEYNRLKDNDTVFAYDLAWEPMFGSQGDRKWWDGEWQKWIIERYGSIENAEKDWGYAVPKNADGSITNPDAGQVGADGEWRRMMAAYRRFLDTLLYKKYGNATRLVHSIDPNHYVSFRMAEASNPEYSWGENIPYEFQYLVSAVDFLSPEAYGRVGNWERVKPGWFQREYARMLAPDKPMIWAEMGVSTWDNGAMNQSPKLLEFQSDFFSNFYQMMTSSGANGLFSWYYPGGYRYDEKSDYGVINPDGSDRQVSVVIRNMGRKFMDAPSQGSKEIWFEIDNDASAIGFAGTYNAVGRKFWAAIDKGLTPRLKTAGTGTTSADCPMIAVGNTLCNTTNPPKYLDGAFDTIEIRNSEGKWVPVEKGGTVQVAKNKPVKARMRITNLGEAKWVSSAVDGQVALTVTGKSTQCIPLKQDVRHTASYETGSITLSQGISAATDLVISLDAMGRTPFGEKFRIRLEPR